jgi:hypothetical protein
MRGHLPIGVRDGQRADAGDAGRSASQQAPRMRDGDRQIGRDRHRRREVAAAHAGAQHSFRVQRRHVDRQVFDPPVVVVDAAADDAQAVDQCRDAGFLAGWTRRQPALQGRQVEHRRIQFHPLHGQVLAARAQRAPRQRDEHALRAQQGCGIARARRHYIVQHQLRGAAQAIVDGAGADLQAQAVAELLQQEPARALRLQ